MKLSQVLANPASQKPWDKPLIRDVWTAVSNYAEELRRTEAEDAILRARDLDMVADNLARLLLELRPGFTVRVVFHEGKRE